MLRILISFFGLLLGLQLNAQTFTNYTSAVGLANNTVNCLTVDAEDNLWFGTDAGISFLDQTDQSWVTLNTAQGTGLIDDRITAIHMSPFSGLWVGTDFGISNWDGQAFTSYTEADGIGDDRIQWIAESEDGQLFFANKDGFSSYDGDDWYVFGQDEGLPFGGVKSMAVSEEDRVILGLGLEGVIGFDISDTTVFPLDTTLSLLSNKVKSVFIDEVGEEVWVASDNGMDRIYNGDNDETLIEAHPSVFELPPPHEVNQLTDVKMDSKGKVWAGVWIEYLNNVGGISFYDGETWTSLDVDDGLVGPVVYQLAIDSEDCVWVATSTGVSKYCDTPSSTNVVSQNTFNFFPNPVGSSLNIELYEISRTAMSIEVLAPGMKVLLKDQIQKGTDNHLLELGHLTSGIYFLRIGAELHKFVKI